MTWDRDLLPKAWGGVCRLGRAEASQALPTCAFQQAGLSDWLQVPALTRTLPRSSGKDIQPFETQCLHLRIRLTTVPHRCVC